MKNSASDVYSLEDLRERVVRIDEEIEALAGMREAFVQVIENLASDGVVVVRPELPGFIVNPAGDASLEGIEVDLEGGDSLREKFILVCEALAARGKVVSFDVVARYLLDRGASSSTLKNMKGTLSHYRGDYESYFEKVRPGVYRYRPDADRSLEGAGELTEVE